MVWHRYDENDPDTWPPENVMIAVRYVEQTNEPDWCATWFTSDYAMSGPHWFDMDDDTTVTHWMIPDVNEVMSLSQAQWKYWNRR